MPDAATSDPPAVASAAASRRGRELALVVLSRWRIEAGYVLAVAAIALAHPRREAIVGWLPLVIAALALRVWARGHLERRKYLTRAGPYAVVRHPLYVGSFMIGFAVAAMIWLPVAPALFTLAFCVAYWPKALREEAFLRARYGDEYRRYARDVGALLPRLRTPRRSRRDARQRFRWRRVLAHGEWKAWLGAALTLALLWARGT